MCSANVAHETEEWLNSPDLVLREEPSTWASRLVARSILACMDIESFDIVSQLFFLCAG